MFELGQEIYYCDVKDGVKKGVVLGYSVNEQGHDVYSVKSGKEYVVVFKNFCHTTEEAAQKELDRIFPLNEQIKAINKEANDKIDALLEEISGKPQYKHLTLKAEKDD